MVDNAIPDEFEIPPGNPTDFWVQTAGGQKLHIFVIDGIAKHLQAWCDEYGISKYAFIDRRKRHPDWPIEKILSTPVKTPGKKAISKRRINQIRHAIFGVDGPYGVRPYLYPSDFNKKVRRQLEVESGQEFVMERMPEIADKIYEKRDQRKISKAKWKSPDDELAILEEQFGERKWQACKRLIAAGVYVAFRKRVKFYRQRIKGSMFSKHVPFYLALQEFPKPKD